jgi:hypothetical protein
MISLMKRQRRWLMIIVKNMEYVSLKMPRLKYDWEEWLDLDKPVNEPTRMRADAPEEMKQ